MFSKQTFSVLLLFPLVAFAADKTTTNDTLNSLEKKASYAVGADIAAKIKATNVRFDAEALSQGLKDSLSGATLLLSPKQMSNARDSYMTQAKAKIQKEQTAIGKTNLEAGNKFLKANAKKDGITTTSSGLQYQVVTNGDGKRPFEDDTVVTHYRGTLIDGREFDSSYSRNKPATFPVNGVIKGWTEALQLMQVGSKWKLFIPAHLAYGATKRSELIQANSTLIFDIELLEIK